jgi:dTDP-4-dehydrorhamnose 3,5-epimerase
MLFTPLDIPGVFAIEAELLRDERGFFARTWSPAEFHAHGLNPLLTEMNISHNSKAGTLRGLHFQIAPDEETKLVRCTRGAIFDVALDLRPASPTFKGYAALELTQENRKALYIPAGCAHGFLTLVDGTEVMYLISPTYAPDQARGYRWNDPAFGIKWPASPTCMSERDRSYPDFVE